MSKITYTDKVDGGLVTPADMNEIKDSVNDNYGRITYDSLRSYSANDICQDGGKFWISKVSSNVGNALPTTEPFENTYWKELELGGGAVISVTYGESISKGDVVYISTDGKAYKADNSTLETAIALGVATVDGVLDDVRVITKAGEVDGYTGLTVGAKYYLGTDGGVVQRDSVPDTGYLVEVGIAVEDDTLGVQVRAPEWNPTRYDDGAPVGSLHRFPTYKDRPGYLPFAFDNAVSQAVYPELYAEVGDMFEAMHVAAGDSASGAGMFYPTPVPGYYSRTGIPDITNPVFDEAGGNLRGFSSTIPSDYRFGTPFKFVVISGTPPTGVVSGSVYFLRYFASGYFYLYPTEADAVAGTNPIAYTDSGSGTFRLTQEGVEIGDALRDWSVDITSGGNANNIASRISGEKTGGTGTIATEFKMSALDADNSLLTSSWSNETRPVTHYEFGYIKAEKGLPAGEPVSALRRDSGWILNSDWTANILTYNHGLPNSLDELHTEVFLSSDGGDTIYKLIDSNSSTSAVYGLTLYSDTLGSVSLRTGTSGITFIGIDGTPVILSGGAWYYKVVVTKPEISGKVYEKVASHISITSDYTYRGLAQTVNADMASGTVTIEAGLEIGTRFKVRKVNSGAGTITIARSGSETITKSALASVTLTSDGDFWELEKVSATRWDLVDGVESGPGYIKYPSNILEQTGLALLSAAAGPNTLTFSVAFADPNYRVVMSAQSYGAEYFRHYEFTSGRTLSYTTVYKEETANAHYVYWNATGRWY